MKYIWNILKGISAFINEDFFPKNSILNNTYD